MPNFYSSFPRKDSDNPSSAIKQIESWTITRETLRFSNKENMQKMRAMEKFAAVLKRSTDPTVIANFRLAEYGADKHGCESIAQAMFNYETSLPEAQQVCGNFLEAAYAIAKRCPGKPHEAMEAVFRYAGNLYSGFDGPYRNPRDAEDPSKENLLLPAVAELFKLTREFCSTLGITLSPAVMAYYDLNFPPEIENKRSSSGLDPAITERPVGKLTPMLASAIAATSANPGVQDDNKVEEDLAAMFGNVDVTAGSSPAPLYKYGG